MSIDGARASAGNLRAEVVQASSTRAFRVNVASNSGKRRTISLADIVYTQGWWVDAFGVNGALSSGNHIIGSKANSRGGVAKIVHAV